MLKTFSAIVIAASVLAAPAMAAGPAKLTDKTTTVAPIAKPTPVASVKQEAKPGLLNAQAKMVRHHHRHVRHHHRFHRKMSLNKTFKHTAVKTTVAHIKRG
jgi:hypothetical protein